MTRWGRSFRGRLYFLLSDSVTVLSNILTPPSVYYSVKVENLSCLESLWEGEEVPLIGSRLNGMTFNNTPLGGEVWEQDKEFTL